ncbi:degv [Trichococcus palustris]|jgi:DegV family protein with EDD domain|uniref:Degv n=1 Tax=Trichococcus palustris TaxID=140314 RepID=A0A143YBJ0_9LACT|nr:DegV family protein [Trichococcus palustris]CZQ84872.1 degv [Trichococcus palustris]SFK54228.1 EDD domain protein, DegV family [Trichococcus palustris]
MTKFKIVTDSTVELSNEEIKQYSITVVPLSSMIANILYYDGVTITKAEFLEKMKKSHELPKSSQPAMGTFLDTYNELTAEGSEVLSIHVAETLSGTVNSAHQAANLTHGKVTVIDSEFCARAMAFQVLEAAKCAEAGLSIKETLQRLEEIKKRTLLYITVVDLENMIKGGRIGKTMGRVTSWLNIKANLQMIDGVLTPDMRGRGTKSIVKRYEAIIAELKKNHVEMEAIGVTHTGLSDYSDQIIRMLQEAFPKAEFFISYASASVITHAGPNAISVQFLTKK